MKKSQVRTRLSEARRSVSNIGGGATLKYFYFRVGGGQERPKSDKKLPKKWNE